MDMLELPRTDFEDCCHFVPEFAQSLKAHLFHGFFGRQGGVSSGVYDSMNCGIGSDDEAAHVLQNREIVRARAGAEILLSLYQVHGNACLVVDVPWGKDERPKADAFVTDRHGIALGILTADCAPVLFSGRKKDGSPVIGAAHAGWGGAFKGVLEETLSKMIGLGALAESVEAAIGPCIGQDSYEVGEEFFDRFIAQEQNHARFFINSPNKSHYMFDLAGYCAHRLKSSGVSQVSVKGLDTYFNEEDFFSYRRATHRGEKDYGRQISVIAIQA